MVYLNLYTANKNLFCTKSIHQNKIKTTAYKTPPDPEQLKNLKPFDNNTTSYKML